MMNLISWTGWTKEEWIEYTAWALVGVAIGLAITTALLIGLIML